MTDLPEPTDEQIEILDKVRTNGCNVSIRSLAGTGKTTTLELIQAILPKSTPVLYLVFAKRNAEEAKGKFPSTTLVKTINGLGHGIWSAATHRKLKVDKKKSGEILRSIIEAAPKNVRGVLWESYWDTINAVGIAKALGYVPDGKFPEAKRLTSREDFYARLDEEPDGLTQDLIDEVITQSIKYAYEGYIDFDDQVYMPAVFGGSFPSFPINFVDEKQDLNPVNHAMLFKLAKHRLIGVGDPNQSIYAFRGAVPSGMQRLEEHFKMEICNLSLCFRCRKAIVENAQWKAPNFRWIKEGGHVETLKQLNPQEIDDRVDEEGKPVSAIICRNNAPLFRAALNLLKAGRSVQVVGSEIGPKVVNILKKLGDKEISRDQVMGAIDEWLAERLAKHSTTANDVAECMRVFAEHGNSLGQAVAYAEHVLAQAGKIQLLTGHKAKGLEFETVYHLDPFLIRDEQDEQELNLRYVIQTRAKDTYYEIDSNRIGWS